MKSFLTCCFLSILMVGCTSEGPAPTAQPIEESPTALNKQDLKKDLQQAATKTPAIAGKSCSLFGNANDVVKCSIQVSGNTGAVAMQMDALFDATQMQFTGVSCAGSDDCQKLSSGHDVKVKDSTNGKDGKLKLLAFSAASLEPMATVDGTLVELNFKLAQTIAEADAQNVSLSNVIFSSDKGQAIPSQIKDGVITLQ
ncbi:MAG: hypothetical protein CMH56_10540 [Myxococcales bacterium]|nr:hypothetical protein [Myxococcales bacterium]|tara:strand:- start:4765 stop:5358 length:594 start_codon:yes stop_codon:yes gene_type:complete